MQNELWIAQITDTHIVPKGQRWLGVNDTASRLQEVIADINSLSPRPDLVVHTGDITEKGDIESYRHIKELLSKLEIPYFLLRGNHDNYQNLKQVFLQHQYFLDDEFAHYVIEHLSVRMIMLDTCVVGESKGLLCHARKNWLNKRLTESDKATLIFLHHYPINVQNEFASSLKLSNSDELEEILHSFTNVKGIYCGHYHFAASALFGNVTCWISPSSAPTHLIDNDICTGLNLSQPCYSLHHYKAGKISSRVINITEKVLFPVGVFVDS